MVLTPYIQPMSKIVNKKGEKRLTIPSSNDPEVGVLTLKQRGGHMGGGGGGERKRKSGP